MPLLLTTHSNLCMLPQAISNATSGGTNEQIKYLVSQVRPPCTWLWLFAEPALSSQHT